MVSSITVSEGDFTNSISADTRWHGDSTNQDQQCMMSPPRSAKDSRWKDSTNLASPDKIYMSPPMKAKSSLLNEDDSSTMISELTTEESFTIKDSNNNSNHQKYDRWQDPTINLASPDHKYMSPPLKPKSSLLYDPISEITTDDTIFDDDDGNHGTTTQQLDTNRWHTKEESLSSSQQQQQRNRHPLPISSPVMPKRIQSQGESSIVSQ